MRSPPTAISCTAIRAADGSSARGEGRESLKRKRWSPQPVRRPFRREGHWPGIPHHMILFGPRYKGLLDDIYKTRRAAGGFLALSAPPDRHRSAHGARGLFDLLCARAGRASGQAAGRLGRRLRRPVRNSASWTRSNGRVIPADSQTIVTSFHYAPTDFGRDLNAHLGSAFRLEPMLSAKRLVPRAQPRRCDFQPLLRRRGHASGRGHSRRRRQRQGDGEADAGGFDSLKRLAVYCGSATPADPRLYRTARAVGAGWPRAASAWSMAAGGWA